MRDALTSRRLDVPFPPYEILQIVILSLIFLGTSSTSRSLPSTLLRRFNDLIQPIQVSFVDFPFRHPEAMWCSLTRTGVRTHFHLFPRLHQFIIPGRRPSFPLRVPLLHFPFFHIYFLFLLFRHFFRLILDGLHQLFGQANLSISYFLSRIDSYGTRAALRLRVFSLEVRVVGRFRFTRAPLSLFHGTVTPSLWPIRLQFLYLLQRSVGLFYRLLQTLRVRASTLPSALYSFWYF